MQGEGQEFESPRLHHLSQIQHPPGTRSIHCSVSFHRRLPTSGSLARLDPSRLGGPQGPHLNNWICESVRNGKSFDLRFRRVVKETIPIPQSSMTTGSAAGGGQATQGTRWMPWRQEPMKDAVGCEKLRGVANRRYIRRCPNGETRLEKSSHSWLNQIGQVEVSQRTETSQ